jgi:tetratricopeptide (TPR) repeat protein
VLAKALKKRPDERYPTAAAIADDLRRHLDHRPVSARADSFGYRARKFIARNRLAVGAAAVVLFALMSGAGLATWQARTAARQRDRALAELRRAESTIDFTAFLLAEATPTAGRPVTNAELLARGEALVERRYARDPVMRVLLLLTLAERYQENQQYDRWRAVLERAFTVSRDIPDAGLRARAACARAIGVVDLGPRDGSDRTAERLIDEALRDLATRPDAVADEAYCRVSEADVANHRGDAARAIPAAERAVALQEGRGAAVGRRFEAGLSLANAYLVAGRADDADGAYRRLIEMLDTQGLGESRDAAIVLTNWSAMWQNMGHHLRAVPLSERAVRLARARDTEKGAGASLLRAYGLALCTVGRCAEAAPLVDEAVAKARGEGSPRRLVSTLVTSATVAMETGNLAGAARALEEAEAVMAADTRSAPSQRAVVDRIRARLARTRGDPAAAMEHARRGLAREPDSARGDYEILQVHLALAEALNDGGDHAAAADAAERALKAALPMLGGLKHSLHVGQARLEHGIALLGLGRTAEGRDELEQAVENLRSSVGPAAPSTRRAVAHLSSLGASVRSPY